MTSRWVPHRWSIRTKVVALVVGYILALGTVYGIFTISLVRREAARTQDRLQQTATLIATELDAYVESGRQRLGTVANLPGMIYGLPSIREASGEGRIPPWTTLHYLFFKSPVFTGGVLLLDRDNKVLWTEPPGQPWIGRALDDPTMAAVYERNDDAISRQLPADALLDRPHVVVAAPVRGPSGQIEGVLAGIVDLTAPALTKILDAVSTREGRFVEVIDQGDRVLAGSDPLRNGQNVRSANGTDWMSASVALTQAPWRVVVGQPRSLALAGLWQWQRYLLLIGLGLLVLGVALGVPLVNGIVRAIKTLTDAAAVIASGDLSRPVTIGERQDELATLARSFEQMRVELEHSRAALEQRLEEREELIRLKEAFLAGISHELRTPLNAIIGYAEMLGDEALSAEGRKQLMTVREQSEHLARMVADLLTLSGLNIGTLPVEVSPVRVAVVLARLRPLAQRLGQGKAVEVVWECPSSLPTLETDPLRLEQILTNLLTNAFKFTTQGRITVRVVDDGEHGQLRFEVSDTGIGIPPHELPHIFDEFRQAEVSLTRLYGGVGLGLALVKRLAELLHGHVAVHSEVGVGSLFTITVPLHFSLSGRASAAA